MSISTRDTLEQALALLREDAGAAYHRLLSELDGLQLIFQVENERFGCRCTRACLIFDAPLHNADMQMQTDRRTILEIIDGKANLMGAVLARSLAVSANVTTLARVSRAATAFAEGALRCRRMRALLAAYRD
jgi:hypothetical protein